MAGRRNADRLIIGLVQATVYRSVKWAKNQKRAFAGAAVLSLLLFHIGSPERVDGGFRIAGKLSALTGKRLVFFRNSNPVVGELMVGSRKLDLGHVA